MRRALDETARRRDKQRRYNRVHGITPRGIHKAVADILEGAHPGAPLPAAQYAQVAEETVAYARETPAALAKKIKHLEQAMQRHARDLEFEQAARLRDEIQHLRQVMLNLSGV